MIETLSIKGLWDMLERLGVEFVAIVSRNNKLNVFVTSKNNSPDRELEELRDAIRNSPDFSDHEAVFIGRNPKFKTLMFAFVHNTNRGLSQGGLRFREYDSVAALISDGLRLSQGMSRKNAISGLWWGGGKGIIAKTPELIQDTFNGDESAQDPKQYKDAKDREQRDSLFEAYGEFVAKLNGVYYTAADMNTYNCDMQAILAKNRFVTCVPRELGGSGDPSPHTAEGVFISIKTVRKHLTGSEDLTGVRVAVQGAGKVGKPLIQKLSDAGAEIAVSDSAFETDSEFLQKFQSEFPSALIVPCGQGHKDDIFGIDVDVISPCGPGGVINAETIEKISPSVKIICGGANNILGDENRDGETLYNKGIVYIPDFACNWMGIVNCANEPFGYLEEDVEKALEMVSPTITGVLEKSDSENISHTAASHHLADEKIKKTPPDEVRINRGQRLIENLIGGLAPVK